MNRERSSEPDAVDPRDRAFDAELGMPAIYRDPPRYDVLAQMTAPDDLAFWRGKVAEHGGPVLELGCGTGRICIELAKLGVEVFGLDRSMELLEFAKEKAELAEVGLTLAPRDMRDFELGRTFALIALPYNVLNHLLSVDDLSRCFAAIRAHMDERSRLVIDTFQPSLGFLGGDPARRRAILRYRDPYASEEILLSEENHYAPATQINTVRWIYRTERTGDERVEEMKMRLFFPAELEVILTLSGLAIVSRHGDYGGEPFESTSSKQLVTCRLAR